MALWLDCWLVRRVWLNDCWRRLAGALADWLSRWLVAGAPAGWLAGALARWLAGGARLAGWLPERRLLAHWRSGQLASWRSRWLAR